MSNFTKDEILLRACNVLVYNFANQMGLQKVHPVTLLI